MWNGVLFVAVFGLAAMYLAEIAWVEMVGVSPIVIAVIFGMIYGNTLRHKLPTTWIPGIQFSAKSLLRLGIILFGFRITFQDIFAVGLQSLIVDLLIIILTFLLAWLVGTRVFKMDSDQSMLIGAGASICGAAAVLATEGVLRSEPHKTSVAVATVVLFGTISMFVYPMLYNAGFNEVMSLKAAGIYIGAVVHEVAQVIVAGNAVSSSAVTHLYDVMLNSYHVIPGTSIEIPPTFSAVNNDVATTAVIVKMTRVLLLAPFLIVLGLFVMSKRQAQAGGEKTSLREKIVIPWFAVWFLVVIGFNSLDLLNPDWIPAINKVSTFLLTMAMAALGIETYYAKVKGAGLQAVGLAAVLTVWLAVGGFFITQAVMAIV